MNRSDQSQSLPFTVADQMIDAVDCAVRPVFGLLAGHALVNDDERPVYVKGAASKLSAEDLAEIRRLREAGQTVKGIGERFGVG